jgi:hypothetical protein
MPFLPGGFDVTDLDRILNETRDSEFVGTALDYLEGPDLDFVPPGFDKGISFYDKKKAEDADASKEKRICSDLKVEGGQLDLATILSHGDHPDWVFDDDVPKEGEQQLTEVKRFDAGEGYDHDKHVVFFGKNILGL